MTETGEVHPYRVQFFDQDTAPLYEIKISDREDAINVAKNKIGDEYRPPHTTEEGNAAPAIDIAFAQIWCGEGYIGCVPDDDL